MLVYQVGLVLFVSGLTALWAKRALRRDNAAHWFYIAPAIATGAALLVFKDPIEQLPLSAMLTILIVLPCATAFAAIMRRAAVSAGATSLWVSKDWFVTAAFALSVVALAAAYYAKIVKTD